MIKSTKPKCLVLLVILLAFLVVFDGYSQGEDWNITEFELAGKVVAHEDPGNEPVYLLNVQFTLHPFQEEQDLVVSAKGEETEEDRWREAFKLKKEGEEYFLVSGQRKVLVSNGKVSIPLAFNPGAAGSLQSVSLYRTNKHGVFTDGYIRSLH